MIGRVTIHFFSFIQKTMVIEGLRYWNFIQKGDNRVKCPNIDKIIHADTVSNCYNYTTEFANDIL